MKRFSFVLSSIIALALLLTACGGQETTTSVPSTNVPPITAEATGTEEMSATETPADGDTTTTPGVPVTGESNSSRLTNLLEATVWNQNNEQVGEVENFVLDLDNSRISYVVVETGGFADIGDKTVLIPWDSLQLQTGMGDATGGQQNALVLLSDPEFLTNAPDVDLGTTLPALGEPAGNWDADVRTFWDTGTVPGTVSTQSAETSAGTAGAGTDTAATAMPEMTATGTTQGTGTTGTGTGQGQSQGQAQSLQGVVLATDVIGSTITIGGGQGQGQGAGTGAATEAQATTVPAATAGTGTEAVATATTGTDTGTGTGTGSETTQATVEDMIVEPGTGDVRYLVIRAADDDTRWIPIPIGFLRWDATNNGFMMMINANALQNAPAFQEDQFPDASTSGWDDDFSTFWQNNGEGSGGTSSGGGVTISTATTTP